MKTLILMILISTTSIAKADIYLEEGESVTVRGTTISCGSVAPQTRYYCTINSVFDGVYSGTGETELEASTNAINACKSQSRGNGIHCQVNSITCESN